jgi:hypothetical protein
MEASVENCIQVLKYTEFSSALFAILNSSLFLS